MDDIYARLENSILAELVDTANKSQQDIFAELVIVAAQSIEKFNSRIMIFKKLKLMPEFVVELESYTGINMKDINRWAQWEPIMPSKPLEILALDRKLRHFFCPEHHQHKLSARTSQSEKDLSRERDTVIHELEETIYQQDCIIEILKGKLLKETLS